jgi:hypothetical protein
VRVSCKLCTIAKSRLEIDRIKLWPIKCISVYSLSSLLVFLKGDWVAILVLVVTIRKFTFKLHQCHFIWSMFVDVVHKVCLLSQFGLRI